MHETTCQICGCQHKFMPKTTVLADHGYRQSWRRYGGDETRTIRCPGSRHLPYEVSRDAISPVIDTYQSAIDRLEASRVKLVADPPATLTQVQRDAYGNVRRQQTHERPADFDPANSTRVSIPWTYAAEFNRRLAEIDADLRGYRTSVAFLQDRYASWAQTIEVAA